MPQIRVHEIARKLGLDNRDVLLRLREAGIPVASNISLVDESCIELIKKAMAQPKKAEPKKQAARAPRKKPAAAARAPAAKAAPKKKAVKKVDAKAAEHGPAAAESAPAPPQAVPAPAPVAARPAPRSAPHLERPPAPPPPPIAPTKSADMPPPPPPAAPRLEGPHEERTPAAALPASVTPQSSRQVPRTAPPVSPRLQAPAPVAPRPPVRHLPARPSAKFPPRRFGPVRRGPKRKGQPKQAGPKGPPAAPTFDTYKALTVAEGITVRDLAEKMAVKSSEILGRLISRGVMATINLSLDPEMAGALAKDFGFELKTMGFEDHALMEEQEATLGDVKATRPPVVTIMGHVDHGKTTLLDALRESNVIATEHGGITQHIGAYTVKGKNKRKSITFLDTPGHEAFTLMRARGAQVTDIVILVVAADDGVMPQTIEAMNHAKAAGVPIIVAINKIDKPDANPDRVKKELSDRGILVESWGGDTVSVELSAKQKLGLDELLEMIHLVADMRELKADPDIQASGTIIEARLDRARGAVATVLVQQGTLRAGDAFIAGSVTGKVRAMFDDRGEKLLEAGPSRPVEILGLQGIPSPGDRFKAVEDETKARQIVAYRQQKLRDVQMRKSSRMTLEHLHEQIRAGKLKELNVILKGDVQGSLEAIANTLERLTATNVKLRFMHQAVGAISESDVLLASSSDAIIIGFNVRPDPNAKALAEKEGVDIRLHTVIYEVADQIQKAMDGLLEPTFAEKWLGRAEVRNVFKVPKFGVVAGSYVQDGQVSRNSDVRLLRDNVVIYQGKISSLRRFKDDVTEVKGGYECGIAIGNFSDIKVGDIIEAFRIEKVVAKEAAS